MGSSEGKAPPGAPYNAWFPGEAKDHEKRGRPHVEVDTATRRAFDELEMISSWAEFVAICEEQKRKRGW